MQIVTINNLTNNAYAQENITLAYYVYQLVELNITHSNNNIYDENSLDRLLSNKTIESYIQLIDKSYVIAIYDNEILIACGFLTIQDNRYFSKSLHVHPKYRGRGLARFICDERENFLREIGVKVIFIESLKFPKTIAFHKDRGYLPEPPYKELKNTILMKKIL